MTTLEKIEKKVSNIDVSELISRLKVELKISETDETEETTEETTGTTIDAETLLEYAIYDTVMLILDVTHQKKVTEEMYSILINMIKDYWYLNKYDDLLDGDSDDESDSAADTMVSSIKEGDTQVNFSQKTSSVTINGITYSTGTINFDQNILVEKYKNDLYRHRKLRW